MIECCVLLALAGQQDKCELIAQGVDVYRDMAATIYGLDRAAFMAIPEDQLSPEETEQRRIGKNGVLSSGYGIGAEGFYRRFCRHVEGGRELAARIVGVYRNQWAPAVPRLWRDLEWTARRAMQRPGQPAAARCGVVYQLTTRVGLPCLICALPNGKLLHYANARIDGADKWGRPRWVYNAYRQGQWREVAPYGGQLTENVVSALARELLVHAMFALEAAGYPIVFTVHDEIVVEHPDIAKETMERIMSERPAWAEKLGVPVKAKAWVGKRYAKGAAPTPPALTDSDSQFRDEKAATMANADAALAWTPPIGHADIAPSRFERIEGDGYLTLDAPWIVPALLRSVPIRGRVLEPAAGRGHISRELKRAGCVVESFDIRAYENPLVPDIGLGDIRKLEIARRILLGGDQSALWRPRRAGRDSGQARDTRPLQRGAARARRMADRKGSAQSDPPASVVPRRGHADLSAAVGSAGAGDSFASAQLRLGDMGRSAARRGCVDPMGGKGPAKPLGSKPNGLDWFRP